MNEEKIYPLRKTYKNPTPNVAKPLIKNVFKTGHVYLLEDFVSSDREMIGLEKIPKAAFDNQKSIEEIKKIFELTETHKKTKFDIRKEEFKG